jgi:hypothetical protein
MLISDPHYHNEWFFKEIYTAPEKAGHAPSGAKKGNFKWEFHLLTYRVEG